MDPVIRHFTDDDLYKFTMACAIIDNFPRAVVSYRFTDRHNLQYPPGFADLVNEQIAHLEDLRFTDDEAQWMMSHCNYLPLWFFTFLRGYRYDRRCARASQDADGRLSIDIEGRWAETVLYEVKLLAIVSELYYRATGLDSKIDLDECRRKSALKARRLIDAGCSFSDFGTRRRASFAAEDVVVDTMKRQNGSGPGRFMGTSNVYLAMKHDVMPVGTMAHEWIAAIAGMYGPQMANHIAMERWRRTYRGALGTFLYDTYGWDIFSLNFSEDYANMFRGLRVDSGDNLEQLDKIERKYRELHIDPRTKQVIFSNALDTDRAIALQHAAAGRVIPSMGIGTHFTNDFDGLRPLNIVIKLTRVKITEKWNYFNDTCKMSEDRGKYTGNPDTVRRFAEIIHKEL